MPEAGAPIVPRWEWRTFGDDFGAADRRFAELTPKSTQESDEVYLLSLESDASVKARGGLMDVKELQAVNADGLEQWLPVLKASYPLSAADVGRVFGVLRTPVPALGRAEYSLDELIDELVAPNPGLRAVEVHKRRRHYSIGGCAAELTDLEAGGTAVRTIAVESEDPQRVTAAVRELGLGPRRNVCLARGLKRLVGFGARRYAVVDVGTNSVKFHIGELQADGRWRTIIDRSEVTRLGEGIDRSGRLGDEPARRTIEAIAGMAAEAASNGVLAVAAVGTAGLRLAANAAEFVEEVRERTGIEIEVIPGEEEGRLAYLAARSGLGLGTGPLVVFDTGGGSSQFTFGNGDRVDERFSVNVGAVRFTERYGLDRAVSADDLAAALEAIAADLARLDGRPAPDTLVGMGGAVTNLAAVKHGLAEYDPDVVQGSVLDRSELDRQIELYRTRTADERRGIAGLQPKRAEVILAGACIVRTVLDKLGCVSLTVSDRGLRHGVLAERFGA
jgi:exopolyphosphatase/guanosine-5'-triphosphate,3'-diphosphate pyrophosphatase